MARHWYSKLEQNPYSKWHRQFDGIAMIDIDSVECCPKCYQPLAFIELAKDVGQTFKAYTLTKSIFMGQCFYFQQHGCCFYFLQ